MQPFVRQVLANASAATSWSSFCAASNISSPAACAAVSSSFATGTANSFARASLLCSALQRCVPTANCSRQLAGLKFLNGSTIQAGSADLDACTAEGVAGGRLLPGVSGSPVLPAGACQNDAQCTSGGAGGGPPSPSTQQFCDASSPSTFCYCQGGTDYCSTLGRCRPTPCAVCSTCLAAASTLTDATRFMAAAHDVASTFSKWCSSANIAAWAPAGACTSSRAAIMLAANTGKRASLLCQRLGACDAATLPATCELSVRKPTALRSGRLVSLEHHSRP